MEGRRRGSNVHDGDGVDGSEFRVQRGAGAVGRRRPPVEHGGDGDVRLVGDRDIVGAAVDDAGGLEAGERDRGLSLGHQPERIEVSERRAIVVVRAEVGVERNRPARAVHRSGSELPCALGSGAILAEDGCARWRDASGVRAVAGDDLDKMPVVKGGGVEKPGDPCRHVVFAGRESGHGLVDSAVAAPPAFVHTRAVLPVLEGGSGRGCRTVLLDGDMVGIVRARGRPGIDLPPVPAVGLLGAPALSGDGMPGLQAAVREQVFSGAELDRGGGDAVRDDVDVVIRAGGEAREERLVSRAGGCILRGHEPRPGGTGPGEGGV